jgi:CarboxypepD_reg-like domain
MKSHVTTTRKSSFRRLKFLGLCTVLSLLSSSVLAQSNDRTVSGIVTSLDGPVYGASIIKKGTAQGVSSNEKGEFTFPEALKENDVLVVSFLGYETAEVKIKGDTTFVSPFLADIPVLIVGALRIKEGNE